MSLIFATIATLLFEAPFFGLEKVLFERKPSLQNDQKALIDDKGNGTLTKHYDSQKLTVAKSKKELEEIEMGKK